MATLSKTDKFVSKLQAGKKLTVEQIMSHCGFTHPNSVYGTVSRLREEGYKIVKTQNRSGDTAYMIS